MQFSKTALMSILALATAAGAAPLELVGTLAPETIVNDERGLEKRSLIAIVLAKVIGTKLLAGAATAGVEAAKEILNPQAEDWKDFGEARRAFTPEMAKDLYEKRPIFVIGIACFNGPYSVDGAGNEVNIVNIKFEWDMYNTDYDCLELYPDQKAYNNGDGGYENIAYHGVCKFENGDYLC